MQVDLSNPYEHAYAHELTYLTMIWIINLNNRMKIEAFARMQISVH